MSRIALSIVSASLIYTSTAHALTIDESVTPKYVEGHRARISVKLTEKDDGLLTFGVTLALKKHEYVVLNTEVRDNVRTLSKNHTQVFSKQAKTTFYFSLPRDLVSTSNFTVSACNCIVGKDGTLVPIPGTINYKVQMEQFVSSVAQKSSFLDNKRLGIEQE